MIMVFMQGGLGNQLFQYAAAKMLSELRNGDSIVIDTDSYQWVSDRRYGLNKFDFPDIHIATEKERQCFRNRVVKRILFFYDSFFKKRGNCFKLFHMCVRFILNKLGIYISVANSYSNQKVPVTNGMLKQKKIYLYGFFQSGPYAYHLKNITLKFPSKGYELWKQNNATGEHICVHIRLGDYLNDSYYGICTKSYYNRAFEYLIDKVKNPIFHIFSDDIEMVKREFIFAYPVIYEEENNANECLMKMRLCKHFILSNSTFSWWAQRLSFNENKIVVAPRRWYGERQRKFYLYDNAWKLIDP